ncbi:MORN repeat-containing protein 3 [Girardinichthys multiradiatus]|uniref:MORN repeat-containing protein 3 n=1 Tax=Girardinichthys multiradiatus TaxID=208333 RepID=UPI001FACF463|nr:MORN repeat-containing protein 3 [Girardinichthys multiradiatus]
MPFFKSFKKSLPTSVQKDLKSQRCGLRHTVYSVSGNEYTGEWLEDEKHGRGIQVWKKVGAIYDGEWKSGKRDGYGTYSVQIPGSKEYTRKYSGGWKNGKKHGYGTYFYNSSAVYEGEWNEDQRSGWGRMYYENGDIYEGEWMKHKSHGQGIIRFSNGNWYEGSWRDGKRNGDGKFYYSDKALVYEGFWVDGVAKCGTIEDVGWDKTPAPPKYQFPKLNLVDMELVLREAKSAYQDHR